MEARKGNGDYYYLGTDVRKDSPTVFLYTAKEVDPGILPCIFSFALEAFSSGWSIIVNGEYKTFYCVLDAAFQMDGRMYAVLYEDVRNAMIRGRKRDVFILDGAYISDSSRGRGRLRGEDIARAGELALSLCDAVVAVNARNCRIFERALDLGRDVAILRPALSEPCLRRLAVEGAAVLDGFSSWLGLPSAYAFETEDGEFRERESARRFSILRL